MKAYEIIKAPIITEKSAHQIMEENVYAFEVNPKANKIEVKNAIEEIFDVKVEKVNIMNCKAKKKRVGKYEGKTARVRKAMIKLAKDSKIEVI
ncbi:MAG: 50S ribosomal protein L23 [Bacilli bacterium]